MRRGRDAPENFPYRALALTAKQHSEGGARSGVDTTDITCFGFGLKLIPFMEAHSRQIFAHQLCEQERAEQVEKVLGEGMQSCGGVLALRVDRGTPTWPSSPRKPWGTG